MELNPLFKGFFAVYAQLQENFRQCLWIINSVEYGTIPTPQFTDSCKIEGVLLEKEPRKGTVSHFFKSINSTWKYSTWLIFMATSSAAVAWALTQVSRTVSHFLLSLITMSIFPVDSSLDSLNSSLNSRQPAYRCFIFLVYLSHSHVVDTYLHQVQFLTLKECYISEQKNIQHLLCNLWQKRKLFLLTLNILC